MKRIAILLTMILGMLACSALPLTTNATQAPPPVPTEAATAVVPVPSETPQVVSPETGTISGNLSYPSEFIPPMRVVFFNVADGNASHLDTAMNQGNYSIDLPPGTYYVVAYPYSADTPTEPAPGSSGLAGGYTQAVPCGLSVDCTDHSLIPVVVIAGQSVTADPGDWYAPEGSFPPMPAP